MNIEHLRSAWNQYGENPDSNINFELLRTSSINKTGSLTFQFKFGAALEIVLSFVFLNYMADVALKYWSVTWEYAVPALVIGLMSLGTIAWNAYALVQLTLVHYDSGIAQAQKRIEKIYAQEKWQNNTLHYVSLPVVSCMLTIMALKFLNLGLSAHIHIIIYAAVGALMVAPFIVWITRLSPDKDMESAIRFLNEIQEFEKEK
jgi:hypothetical protein